MAVVKVCWVMLITQNLYKELMIGIKEKQFRSPIFCYLNNF